MTDKIINKESQNINELLCYDNLSTRNYLLFMACCYTNLPRKFLQNGQFDINSYQQDFSTKLTILLDCFSALTDFEDFIGPLIQLLQDSDED